MSTNMNHSTGSALARFGHRIAAVVAECNKAQTLLTSSRNTPAHF
jgi:hypothetical protein